MDKLSEALELLSRYVSVAPYAVVDSLDFSWETFPAVAKADSMEHKTDKNAVFLHLRNLSELKDAVKKLLQDYESVIIQPELKGVEVFLGGKEDPSFGPTISLGLGGIFVEVYKDVSTRLAPLTGADVLDMISELKGRKLLEGYRGIKTNFNALVKSVVGFSQFLVEYRPKTAEINPLILNEEGAYAVDARVFL